MVKESVDPYYCSTFTSKSHVILHGVNIVSVVPKIVNHTKPKKSQFNHEATPK
jgi:hypothetical protein